MRTQRRGAAASAQCIEAARKQLHDPGRVHSNDCFSRAVLALVRSLLHLAADRVAHRDHLDPPPVDERRELLPARLPAFQGLLLGRDLLDGRLGWRDDAAHPLAQRALLAAVRQRLRRCGVGAVAALLHPLRRRSLAGPRDRRPRAHGMLDCAPTPAAADRREESAFATTASSAGARRQLRRRGCRLHHRGGRDGRRLRLELRADAARALAYGEVTRAAAPCRSAREPSERRRHSRRAVRRKLYNRSLAHSSERDRHFASPRDANARATDIALRRPCRCLHASVLGERPRVPM